MDAARLLLVRHGQTAGNLSSGMLLMGTTDLPLTVEGFRQARSLAARLRPWPFQAIYSSPLQRAATTAREIAAVHRVPLYWCAGVREMDCGWIDGFHVATVQRRHPAVWEANERQDDPDFRWPGGESYRELRRRILGACDRIAARHPGEAVVVVTHAGVINQVIGTIVGFGPAFWEPYRPDHCTVTRIDWSRGAGHLVAFNAEPSLRELPTTPVEERL